MFPLIISASVMLQSLSFTSVQSLNEIPILFDGCGKTGQLVFPGLRLASTAYTAIANNGSALAGLHHHASFRARDRLSIATSRSLFEPQPMVYLYCHRRDNYCDLRHLGGNECHFLEGGCLTNQIWCIERYAKLAVVLAPILLALYPAGAVIISVQLVKAVKVDRAERVAATRMVYYLVFNTWLTVCTSRRQSQNSYLCDHRRLLLPITSKS